jgi:hypothetical protein
MRLSVALSKAASLTANAQFWEKMRSNSALFKITQTMLQQLRMTMGTCLEETMSAVTIGQR